LQILIVNKVLQRHLQDNVHQELAILVLVLDLVEVDRLLVLAPADPFQNLLLLLQEVQAHQV
jgi:hypothetical protein